MSSFPSQWRLLFSVGLPTALTPLMVFKSPYWIPCDGCLYKSSYWIIQEVLVDNQEWFMGVITGTTSDSRIFEPLRCSTETIYLFLRVDVTLHCHFPLLVEFYTETDAIYCSGWKSCDHFEKTHILHGPWTPAVCIWMSEDQPRHQHHLHWLVSIQPNPYWI